MRAGQPPRDVASLWKRDPGSGSAGINVSELPVGSAYDLPYLEEPFPRPSYANPRNGPPRPFFLPDQQELRVAAYLPEYTALHTEPAREEFDLLYFSTARRQMGHSPQDAVYRVGQKSSQLPRGALP